MSILENKRNGVLFVIGETLICRRIQAHTRQIGIKECETASHVAYKFWHDSVNSPHPKMVHKPTGEALKTGWYVIESHIASGVAVFPLLKWGAMNLGSTIKSYEDDSYNLKLMLDLIGAKYDVKSILAIKLRTDFEYLGKNKFFKLFGFIGNFINKIFEGDGGGIYCSELLSLANNEISKVIGKKAFESWPSDFQKYYLNLHQALGEIKA